MANQANASTYTRFSNNDQVNSVDRVFASARSGGANTLTTAFSSSTQYNFTTATTAVTSSAAFFMEIYDKNPQSDTTAEVQYSISYGSKTGLGGLDFNNDTGASGFSATKAIYSQYRNLIFGGDETQNFSFNGHVPDSIFVININRARYKHNLKPGTLDLKISQSRTADNSPELRLTDDSVTKTGSATVTNAGRQFNIVSGSLGTMSG
jgi:hypothetical protein